MYLLLFKWGQVLNKEFEHCKIWCIMQFEISRNKDNIIRYSRKFLDTFYVWLKSIVYTHMAIHFRND